MTNKFKPIFRLLRKNQPTVWNDDCQRAFEKIREYLLSPPVLVPSTLGRPLLLYLSVSDMALGCIIGLGHQEAEALCDRVFHIIEFDIQYVTQKSVKGSIVVDHLASLPVSNDKSIDDDFPYEHFVLVTNITGWRLYFDGVANQSGFGISILLISPQGLETTLDLGIRQLEINGDSNLVIQQTQGIWRNQDEKLKPYHAYLDLLVDRSAPAYCCLIGDIEDQDEMIARGLIIVMFRPCLCRSSDERGSFQRCPECQMHGDIIHVPPSELHALTSPWPFSVWGIEVIGKISPKSSSGHEYILVVVDYFTKWVETASYARLIVARVAKFIRSMAFSITDRLRTSCRLMGQLRLVWYRGVLPVEIEMGSLRVALEQQISETEWAQFRDY
ncbi:hypothetical protein CK203_053596 [Vitis vinifera]|uniref:Integrase catalytic domain-containing protein n=1 Tax=Vitis vinifera TaxID=29760 RepID=A0A438HI77_VITVI|nr:hypothetical protein CK203_053596 [Vitis vinifera]